MRPSTASSNDVRAIVKSFASSVRLPSLEDLNGMLDNDTDDNSTKALVIKGALHASHSGKNDSSTDVHHTTSSQRSLRAPTNVVSEVTDIHDDRADRDLFWAKQLGREARARVEGIDVGRAVNDNSR